MGARWRLGLVRGGVALLAAWSLVHLTFDARWKHWVCDQPEPVTAGNYRVGGPTWERLADFASWIEEVVPAGERIVFRNAHGKIGIARYAAYLLPRHDVVTVQDKKLPRHVGFAASFGGPWPAHALEAIAQHPDGWIYRRR